MVHKLHKYLEVDNDLNVIEAHREPKDTSNPVYEVYHLQPFDITDKNITDFFDTIFQGLLSYKIKFNGTTLNKESTRKQGYLLMDNEVKLDFDVLRGINGTDVCLTSIYFRESIFLNNNKNSFKILKKVKNYIDSFYDWPSMRDKIKEKLLQKYGKRCAVNGFIQDRDGDPFGQFTVTIHKDLMDKLKLKLMTFSLKNKELRIENVNRSVDIDIMSKCPSHFRKLSKDFNTLADSVDEIESIVRWVIFSYKREERLKKLLEKS